jgi:hypothetical protein
VLLPVNNQYNAVQQEAYLLALQFREETETTLATLTERGGDHDFVDKAYRQRFEENFVCEPLPDTKENDRVPAKPEQCTLDGYNCFQPKQH